jgi:hypothetical protein
MNVQILRPLSDQRWNDFVSRHPRASVFHQRGWLDALARTYRYEPVVLTTAGANEPLSDGIVFCKVSSRITGTRFVSLPFADHCEPLVAGTQNIEAFFDGLRSHFASRSWKYFELRPLSALQRTDGLLQSSDSFWFHQLDTTPTLDHLAKNLHPNSFWRKIRRAEREKLSYEVGCSSEQLNEFYRLLLTTRRRHGVLPQPRAWFKNLVDCMGDQMQIRLVRKDRTPIAAMVTLRHRSSIVYKYGCSDAKFHSLGGIPLLFWKLIEESKATAAENIDLGRSEMDNQGLVTFKDRLGATKTLLKYYRYEIAADVARTARKPSPAIRRVISILPDSVLSTAGGLVYRHIG